MAESMQSGQYFKLMLHQPAIDSPQRPVSYGGDWVCHFNAGDPINLQPGYGVHLNPGNRRTTRHKPKPFLCMALETVV